MITGYDIAKMCTGIQEHRDIKVLMDMFKEQKIMDPNNPKQPFNPDGSIKGGLPWCAAFVTYCEKKSGANCLVKLGARQFLEYGTTIKGLNKAKEGDIVVFERGNNGYSGHVGYFVSYDRDDDQIRVLGGNQQDAVCIVHYSASRLLGIRRSE